jgi:hypothetical protein
MSTWNGLVYTGALATPGGAGVKFVNLAILPRWQPGGKDLVGIKYALLAQLVEHNICNIGVTGSTPVEGPICESSSEVRAHLLAQQMRP